MTAFVFNRRRIWLGRILLTVAMSCLGFIGNQAAAQTRHALIFSPNDYQSLPAAPHFQQATSLLTEQLKRCGFDAANIQTLSGQAATVAGLQTAIEEAALTIVPGDDWVVVIQSYGIEKDGVDHVATFQTQLDERGELASGAIAVDELLRLLAQVSETRQLIVVDGFGPFDGLREEAAAGFGRSLPTPGDGQVLIVGRDAKLTEREGRKMTAFAWAVSDGLDGHADANRNGTISALELTRYCVAFAQDAQIRTPRVAGKMTGDHAVFLIGESHKPRHADVLNDQAKQLLTEAYQALHLELDARAAINLLDRARRLCRDEELMLVIDDYRFTANVLYEGFSKAVEDWPKRGRNWSLIAVTESDGQTNRRVLYYEPGSPDPSFTLPSGTVVEVANRSGKWLEVVSVRRPAVVDGTLEFQNLQVPLPGYVRVSDFEATQSRVVPSQYLRSQLEKTRVIDDES